MSITIILHKNFVISFFRNRTRIPNSVVEFYSNACTKRYRLCRTDPNIRSVVIPSPRVLETTSASLSSEIGVKRGTNGVGFGVGIGVGIGGGWS